MNHTHTQMETNIYIYIYIYIYTKKFSRHTFTHTQRKNNNISSLFLIMKNLELKNNDKIKEILDTTKIIKIQIQPKNLKRILTSFTFGENNYANVIEVNLK